MCAGLCCITMCMVLHHTGGGGAWLTSTTKSPSRSNLTCEEILRGGNRVSISSCVLQSLFILLDLPHCTVPSTQGAWASTGAQVTGAGLPRCLSPAQAPTGAFRVESDAAQDDARASQVPVDPQCWVPAFHSSPARQHLNPCAFGGAQVRSAG